ncbi:MBL fold metallo-hydrolase [Halalkalibacterium ligniniphilum]|uniref:MBL fold metallo-hydrolase n=1 Tax=Halalkalibacterium ligniniphilum TaxID=1134413 RepID=UPI00034C3E84|nr:MBL fold metallo-hydrolase [Halalkalibacterium ligniniphilum]
MILPIIHQITLPTPFLVGPVHSYLIVTDTVTLVDAGPKTEEAWQSLEEQLKELGYKPENIDQVILTHHHPDHVGLAARLQKHARLIGHPYLKPWLGKEKAFFEQYVSFFHSFYEEHGLSLKKMEQVRMTNRVYMKYVEKASIDLEVRDGDSILSLPGWIVYEVPGHAQSHIMLVHHETGTAIGGDVLLAKISSNAILEAPYNGFSRPKTLLQYRYSLRKLSDMNIQRLYPGHGPVIENVNELVEERLKGHEKRAAVIKKIIERKKMTASQICEQLFPDMHEKQPELTFSETFGHLDFLMEKQEISSIKHGSKTFFTV